MTLPDDTSHHFHPQDFPYSIFIRRVRQESADAPVVLIMHGLGDHLERQDWMIRLLHQMGFDVLAFDWPGNGQSGGPRGRMPLVKNGIQLVGRILEHEQVAPAGVFAHSTGAYYLLSGMLHDLSLMSRVAWVHLSSPLLLPSHRQAPLRVKLAKKLGALLPHFHTSTGVRFSDCYHLSHSELVRGLMDKRGCHNRISLEFAADILLREEALWTEVARLPLLHWLITEGDQDNVCPPAHAERLYHQLQAASKTMIVASGSRHEPFHEPHARSLVNSIRSWLELRRGRTGARPRNHPQRWQLDTGSNDNEALRL